MAQSTAGHATDEWKEVRLTFTHLGTLIPTHSCEFPFFILGSEGRPILVPSSRLFQVPVEGMSKSEAVKRELPHSYTAGMSVRGTVVDVEGTMVATRLQYEQKMDRDQYRNISEFGILHPNGGILKKVQVVFNQWMQMCYTPELKGLNYDHERAKRLLSDVVYEAWIHIWAVLEEDPNNPGIPRPRVQARVHTFRVAHSECRDVLQLAPWRKDAETKPQKFLGNDFNPGPEPKGPTLHFQRIRADKVTAMYLGDHHALYLDNPRRKLLIADLDMIEKLGPDPVGVKIGVDAYWSKTLYTYIAYKVSIKGEKRSRLHAERLVDDMTCNLHCTSYQFYVRVVPADVVMQDGIYRGFYMAVREDNPQKPLFFSKPVLIEDPLLVLCASELPAEGVRVGIRPNIDYFRVAKFSITCLDPYDPQSSGLDFSRRPDIESEGFLADDSRVGAVFSAAYPQLRFFLPMQECSKINVGTQLCFSATFYEKRRGYVILNWKQANDKEPQRCYPSPDGYLFSDRIRRSRMHFSDKCCSLETFGLVTDTKNLAWDWALVRRVEMPKNGEEVLVRENLDSGRSTFFDLHTLETEQWRNDNPSKFFKSLLPKPHSSNASNPMVNKLCNAMDRVLAQERT